MKASKKCIEQIEIGLIDSPRNSRMSGTDDVSGLMTSISKLGLLQPIAVTKQDGRYRVIYGNRRLDACKKLGFRQMPVIIKDDMDDIREVKENLAENTARKPITGSELYKYILHLASEGLSDAEIAANIGLSPNRVYHIKKAGKTLKLQYLDKLEVDFPETNKTGHKKGRTKRTSTNLSSNLITKLVTLKKSYGSIFNESIIDHISENHHKINPKNLFGYIKYIKKAKHKSEPKVFDMWLSHMATKAITLNIQFPIKDIEKFGIKATIAKIKKDMIKHNIIPKEGNV